MSQIARPAHPGQFIKMEIIEPLGITVTMDTLLRMQAAYQIANTRDNENDVKVKRFVPKQRGAPSLA